MKFYLMKGNMKADSGDIEVDPQGTLKFSQSSNSDTAGGITGVANSLPIITDYGTVVRDTVDGGGKVLQVGTLITVADGVSAGGLLVVKKNCSMNFSFIDPDIGYSIYVSPSFRGDVSGEVELEAGSVLTSVRMMDVYGVLALASGTGTAADFSVNVSDVTIEAGGTYDADTYTSYFTTLNATSFTVSGAGTVILKVDGTSGSSKCDSISSTGAVILGSTGVLELYEQNGQPPSNRTYNVISGSGSHSGQWGTITDETNGNLTWTAAWAGNADGVSHS
jgi:hypothetical protein